MPEERIDKGVAYLIGGRRFGLAGLPNPGWVALARSGQTLCIYGDVDKFAGIARELLRGGREADEPVAIVSTVSLPEQNVIVSELQKVINLSIDNIPRPAMMVVGRAVAWRPACSWFEKRPLYGRIILLARARMHDGCLAAALREQGATVMEMPIVAGRHRSRDAQRFRRRGDRRCSLRFGGGGA